MEKPLLYDYWRSSASYRVRIALNLKGFDYDQRSVHLVRDGGEQHADDYRSRNPQGLVPTLATEAGNLTQSLAIIEYLEEVVPEPALLPGGPVDRARVRSLALLVACEIHPLDNLRVLQFLTGPMGLDDTQKMEWYRHWIQAGFSALETRLENEPETGEFCHQDQPSLADLCLVPQVYNAERFDCDLSAFSNIRRIATNCRNLPAFEQAAPERQPDAH